MNRLLIIGAGGHSRVILETAQAIGCYSDYAYLDDKYTKEIESETINGIPIIGKISYLSSDFCKSNYNSAIVAIGDSAMRVSILKKLLKYYQVPFLIHPNAYVAASATLDNGTVVFAQAAVQSNAVVGEGCIINTCASIDHDVVLAEGVHICPGAHLAGNVRIGKSTWVGIGSSIIQNINIGSNVYIGAGSVVLKDINSGSRVAGVPARAIS
ncbi:acetyltransferase [Prochlorococcus sp. MIT 1223]|uniref:acetyltransferase n=1 Tax=Prochlorococcus sp. MIT 1223 TaxID=3096217 RepID=UPI002A758791|nr:acetyltransferase [Prochlorococcus sp. MIT 1223]